MCLSGKLSVNSRFPFIMFMKCYSRADLRYSHTTFWMRWNPREQRLANVCFLITEGYEDLFGTVTRECVSTLFNTTVLRLYMHHFWWPQHSFPHTHVHAGRLSHIHIQSLRAQGSVQLVTKYAFIAIWMFVFLKHICSAEDACLGSQRVCVCVCVLSHPVFIVLWVDEL